MKKRIVFDMNPVSWTKKKRGFYYGLNIIVTPSGITSSFDWFLANADEPRVVTVSGIITLVNPYAENDLV